MRTHNFKTFDVYTARELEVGMTVSIHRDIGILYGTIEEFSNNEDRITIVIGNIVTDPEEKSFYPTKTTITLEYPGDKQIKVKISLADLLKNV